MGNKTAICTINYTSASDTLNLLRVLDDLEGDFELFLIENGSPKNKLSLSDLPKTKYKIHFYVSKKNLGFAGGNNYLISKALKNSNFKYFWLLNNDTVPRSDSLVNLLKVIDIKKDAGIIGSVVLQDDKTIWWAGSKVDLVKGKITKNYFGKQYKILPKEVTKTDEVNGAVMLIKRDVVEKIGLLDMVFFHTAEDTDYSLRALKYGYNLYLNPKSIVVHHVGKSSGGAYSAMHMFYVERGRIMLMRKWNKLNYKSFILLTPFLLKRILAPVIRKGDLKSSLYTIKGIIEGLFIKI